MKGEKKEVRGEETKVKRKLGLRKDRFTWGNLRSFERETGVEESVVDTNVDHYNK